MKLSNNNYICQSPGFCSFPYGKQQALSSLSTLISSICFCALTSVDSCSSRIYFCPTSVTKENCLPVSYFPASVPVKISSHNSSLFRSQSLFHFIFCKREHSPSFLLLTFSVLLIKTAHKKWRL